MIFLTLLAVNILALDLATKTGYAYNSGDRFYFGTWTLGEEKALRAARLSRMDRRNDLRVHELYKHLSQEMAVWPDPQIVIFEDVQFASSTDQVQLWSSLRTAVWLAFPPSSGVNVECVNVARLKSYATGYGSAKKPLMEKYLRLRHPEIYSHQMDDNAVDAAWLWLWAKEHLTRMSPNKSILRAA